MKLLYVLYSGDANGVERKIGEKGSWYSYYFTLSDVPTEGDEIWEPLKTLAKTVKI